MIVVRIATHGSDRGRSNEFRNSSIAAHYLRDGATDAGDSQSELLAGENIFEFSDQWCAGKQVDPLLTSRREDVGRSAAP